MLARSIAHDMLTLECRLKITRRLSARDCEIRKCNKPLLRQSNYDSDTNVAQKYEIIVN